MSNLKLVMGLISVFAIKLVLGLTILKPKIETRETAIIIQFLFTIPNSLNQTDQINFVVIFGVTLEIIDLLN